MFRLLERLVEAVPKTASRSLRHRTGGAGVKPWPSSITTDGAAEHRSPTYNSYDSSGFSSPRLGLLRSMPSTVEFLFQLQHHLREVVPNHLIDLLWRGHGVPDRTEMPLETLHHLLEECSLPCIYG
jgi:hypothetical protein